LPSRVLDNKDVTSSESSFCSITNADLDLTPEDDHIFAAIGPVEIPHRTRRGSTYAYSVEALNCHMLFNARARNEIDFDILKMRFAIGS
jgi:hypothetical protein